MDWVKIVILGVLFRIFSPLLLEAWPIGVLVLPVATFVFVALVLLKVSDNPVFSAGLGAACGVCALGWMLFHM